MSFRPMVLAAVMAVGIGQVADAALVEYDIVITVNRANYYYYPIGGENHSTPLGGWWGLKTGVPTAGILRVQTYDTERAIADLIIPGIDAIFVSEGYSYLRDGYYSWLGVGSSYVGGLTSLTWNGNEGSLIYGQDHLPHYTIADASFSVIPLPASAALLPLGIGAIAMMRKRRRAVS